MKPFQYPFTAFHNYTLDHIMPDLSNSGWKILCVAIRQTLGWADDESPTGRKQEDEISYSQFMEKSGIRSRTTVSKAISENLGKGYLVRREVGKHPGTKKPIYAYRLNTDYEVASPENEPASPKSEPEPGPENGLEASPENGHTKERKGEQKQKEEVALTQEEKIWLAALGELKLQMTKATFDTWLKPTELLSCEDDTFIIKAKDVYAKEWLEDRLLSTVRRTLIGIVEHPVDVQFVVEV